MNTVLSRTNKRGEYESIYKTQSYWQEQDENRDTAKVEKEPRRTEYSVYENWIALFARHAS